MNELMTFTNDRFGKLRAILFNGIIYFVGEDVATSLEFNDVNKTIQTYVDKEDRILLSFEIHSNNMPYLWNENDFSDKFVINENGIYSLIFKNNKPETRRYKEWITFEVLPNLHYKVYRAIPCAKLSDIKIISESDNSSREPMEYKSEKAFVKIYSKIDLKDFEIISKEEKQHGVGYFYLVEINNDVKIGCTQNPIQRYNTLEREIVKYGGGTIGKMALSQPHGNYQENEKHLHNYFSRYRVDGTELFIGDLNFFINNLPELKCYERNQRHDKANESIGYLFDFVSSRPWMQ